MPQRIVASPAIYPVVLGLLVAGCTTAPRVSKAPPSPPPRIVAPPPPVLDWRDVPLSPGRWRYATDAGGSSASFGRSDAAVDFTIRCLKPARQIVLARPGAGDRLTIRTSYASRDLPARAGETTLAATDPLLDQIAFSRGRFSVEAAGTALLMMPAWAEPGRVIEDCRL